MQETNPFAPVARWTSPSSGPPEEDYFSNPNSPATGHTAGIMEQHVVFPGDRTEFGNVFGVTMDSSGFDLHNMEDPLGGLDHVPVGSVSSRTLGSPSKPKARAIRRGSPPPQDDTAQLFQQASNAVYTDIQGRQQPQSAVASQELSSTTWAPGDAAPVAGEVKRRKTSDKSRRAVSGSLKTRGKVRGTSRKSSSKKSKRSSSKKRRKLKSLDAALQRLGNAQSPDSQGGGVVTRPNEREYRISKSMLQQLLDRVEVAESRCRAATDERQQAESRFRTERQELNDRLLAAQSEISQLRQSVETYKMLVHQMSTAEDTSRMLVDKSGNKQAQADKKKKKKKKKKGFSFWRRNKKRNDDDSKEDAVPPAEENKSQKSKSAIDASPPLNDALPAREEKSDEAQSSADMSISVTKSVPETLAIDAKSVPRISKQSQVPQNDLSDLRSPDGGRSAGKLVLSKPPSNLSEDNPAQAVSALPSNTPVSAAENMGSAPPERSVDPESVAEPCDQPEMHSVTEVHITEVVEGADKAPGDSGTGRESEEMVRAPRNPGGSGSHVSALLMPTPSTIEAQADQFMRISRPELLRAALVKLLSHCSHQSVFIESLNRQREVEVSQYAALAEDLRVDVAAAQSQLNEAQNSLNQALGRLKKQTGELDLERLWRQQFETESAASKRLVVEKEAKLKQLEREFMEMRMSMLGRIEGLQDKGRRVITSALQMRSHFDSVDLVRSLFYLSLLRWTEGSQGGAVDATVCLKYRRSSGDFFLSVTRPHAPAEFFVNLRYLVFRSEDVTVPNPDLDRDSEGGENKTGGIVSSKGLERSMISQYRVVVSLNRIMPSWTSVLRASVDGNSFSRDFYSFAELCEKPTDPTSSDTSASSDNAAEGASSPSGRPSASNVSTALALPPANTDRSILLGERDELFASLWSDWVSSGMDDNSLVFHGTREERDRFLRAASQAAQAAVPASAPSDVGWLARRAPSNSSLVVSPGVQNGKFAERRSGKSSSLLGTLEVGSGDASYRSPDTTNSRSLDPVRTPDRGPVAAPWSPSPGASSTAGFMGSPGDPTTPSPGIARVPARAGSGRRADKARIQTLSKFVKKQMGKIRGTSKAGSPFGAAPKARVASSSSKPAGLSSSDFPLNSSGSSLPHTTYPSVKVGAAPKSSLYRAEAAPRNHTVRAPTQPRQVSVSQPNQQSVRSPSSEQPMQPPAPITDWITATRPAPNALGSTPRPQMGGSPRQATTPQRNDPSQRAPQSTPQMPNTAFEAHASGSPGLDHIPNDPFF